MIVFPLCFPLVDFHSIRRPEGGGAKATCGRQFSMSLVQAMETKV
jgi:hypothetical protein